MPVAFEGPPDELAGLAMFLEEQRAALLRKIDGVSDQDAKRRPTPSGFSLLTLIKHVAYVERRWFQIEVARREAPGLWPPPDDREHRIEEGDTIESVRALYESVIEENRAILATPTSADLSSLSANNLNRRWILLHLIEELARHAGHADIIRETLDGVTGA
ncbi:MAG TPA: DinB family protein [Acidimicrobiales bacterium]|nr:DinB family protein [Acidimicrobiales bacterium]